jgi:Flp pilus assembly protein TadD
MSKHPVLTADALVLQIASLVHDKGFEQGLQIAETAISQNLQSGNLYHLAGVCAVHLGLREQAGDFWRAALALSPMHAEVHANLAVLLHEARRDDEAETWYRSALQLQPANAYLHARFAALLASRKQGAQAEHHYRRALALDPADAGTHANLGVLLSSARRHADAEQCYRQALALAPDNVPAHINLGLLLAGQGALQAAQQCYARALELEPGNAAAFSNLGLLLEQDKNDELAEQCHQTASRLAPELEEVLCNLGNFLARLHRYEEAENSYRRAIALKSAPENTASAATYTSLGVLLTETDRAEEAEACFRRAVQVDAAYPLAASNLAVLLFQQQRYPEAWPYYEARHDPLMARPVARPPASCGALWQGESVAGKSMLVWPEQGLGDMIHFCRYIPQLKLQGAAHVTLVCYPDQHVLLSTLAGVDASIRLGEEATLPAHDYCVLTMSLPGYLQANSAPAPAALPYLHTTPERHARWLQRLTDLAPHREGLRVGLVWKGNPNHANDAERSLKTVDQLAPLWSIPGIQWVSLQKTEDVIATPAGLDPLHWLPLGHELLDFADTAAVVDMLDLVICVDTSVAHLAGALGKACWLLLPAYKTDWRWLQARSDTPWYPHSMRLFRQPHRGDWLSPINAIAIRLKARLAQRGAD